MGPSVGVDELVDVAGGVLEVNVLLIVERRLVAIDRAAGCGCGGFGDRGQVVVMPRAVVVQLVDMAGGVEVVDVLLLVEGGLVAVRGRARDRRGCAGDGGEIIVRPRVGVIELVDVTVGVEEVDVLLIVEVGLVAVDGRAAGSCGRTGESGQIVMVP